MCNAYTVRPKVGAKELAAAVSAAISRLPSRLVRRGGPGVVVAETDGSLSPEIMRWGFDHPKYKLVNNARSESLTRGMWVEPLAECRCLVPMSSFYEWQDRGGSKQAFEFRRPDGEWLWIAGLYERGPEGNHYATITTEPTEAIRVVHDRLLAIVGFDEGLAFLRGGNRAFAPYAGEIAFAPCPSPLKRPKDKPDEEQGSFF